MTRKFWKISKYLVISTLVSALSWAVWSANKPQASSPNPGTALAKPVNVQADPHAHHKTGKKHVDPGPRRIPFSQRLAERRAAELALPPYEAGKILEQSKDNLTLLKDGIIYNISTNFHTRHVPYAYSALEADLYKRELIETFISSMDHTEHDHCAQDLVDRGLLKGDVLFTLIIHISTVDGMLVSDDVESPNWPAEFDEAAKECYLSAFRGVKAPTDKVDSFYFNWPVCVRDPLEITNKPKQ